MKKLMLLGLCPLLLTLSAQAEQFSTAVNVSKRAAQLSIVQNTPVSLPQVTIDVAAEDNGSKLCDTTGFTGFPGKDYCTGQSNNGVFTLVGNPSSTVSIKLPTGKLVQNGIGLRLFVADGSPNGKVLNANGTLNFEVVGELSLEDKSQLSNSQQVFDFEITAVYD